MARNGSKESEARQIDRMSTALRVVEQLSGAALFRSLGRLVSAAAGKHRARVYSVVTRLSHLWEDRRFLVSLGFGLVAFAAVGAAIEFGALPLAFAYAAVLILILFILTMALSVTCLAIAVVMEEDDESLAGSVTSESGLPD